MKKLLFLGCMLLVGLWSHAQTPPDSSYLKIYSAEVLKSDLKFFLDALREAHPALDRYNSPTAFNAFASELLADLDSPMNEIEFHKIIAKVVAGLNDGHSWTNVSKTTQERYRLLPLVLKNVHRKLYVTDNFGAIQVPLYSQLLEVNGYSVSGLLTHFSHYHSSDGYISTSAPYEAEGLGFSRLYHLYKEASDTFRLTLVTPTGIEIETTVLAQNALALFKAAKKRLPPAKDQTVLALEKLEEASKSALLTVASFHPPTLRKAKVNYQRALRRSFRKLRKDSVENLVIDLRDNGGGHTRYAAKLYSYLTDKPFDWLARVEVVKTDPPSFIEHTSIKRRKFWRSKHFELSPEGKYVLRKNRELEPIKPARRNQFAGKVFVLTSGKTFSASALFCSVVKDANRATFIGEETGGAYQEISTAGAKLTLPKTGIEISFLW